MTEAEILAAMRYWIKLVEAVDNGDYVGGCPTCGGSDHDFDTAACRARVIAVLETVHSSALQELLPRIAVGVVSNVLDAELSDLEHHAILSHEQASRWLDFNLRSES